MSTLFGLIGNRSRWEVIFKKMRKTIDAKRSLGLRQGRIGPELQLGSGLWRQLIEIIDVHNVLVVLLSFGQGYVHRSGPHGTSDRRSHQLVVTGLAGY